MRTLKIRTLVEWEKWLERNHFRSSGVWLVYRKGKAGFPSISYEESVQAALAYGWVDSLVKRIDKATYARKFTPRRPGSIWSQTNIDRIEKLKSLGRMTKWGLAIYDMRSREKSLAERLDKVELDVPDDLRVELEGNAGALANFERLSLSRRRKYFMWIAAAKRLETRRRRVEEAVKLISRDVKDLLK